MQRVLSYVIVGAHPDDCEIYAGGITILLRQAGHKVTFITTTNGNAGHYRMSKSELQARRFAETRNVAACLGAEYEVMDNDDGCLEPSLENRHKLIRILRKHQPDVIITHPTDDYHPDHRYTSQLVADTAYMLNVPMCVPDVPAMHKQALYLQICTSPQPRKTTILVPIDKVIEQKIHAVHQNTSQIYEWLPWTEGIDPDTIGTDEESRRKYIEQRWLPEWEIPATHFQNDILSTTGNKPCNMRFIEAFCASPWGLPWNNEYVQEYFPWANCIVVNGQLT